MLIPWTSSLVAAADTGTVAVDDDGVWTGTVALVNEWSADRRMLELAEDAEVDVRPLPLPVTVQYVTGPGHDGAAVGLMTLDEVWRDGARLMGRGRVDMDDPQGAALARKIRKGFFRFVSADVDKVDGRVVCIGEDGQPVDDCDPAETGMDTGELYTQWRIMGAALLAHPAFPEAQIGMAASALAVGDAPEAEVEPEAEEPADNEDQDQDEDEGAPTHAGIAVKALDTGRVLLIQRALDEDDPASGTWEFPGGGIEDGEDPQAAAFREFAEETGITLPDDVEVVDGWRSENGVYQGYVATVPTEADLAINPDPEDRAVLNPDDPDGDMIEVVAWWDINALPDMPALREEARATPWQLLADAGAEAMTAAGDVVSLAASAFAHPGWLPDTSRFNNPRFTEPTKTTITEDGHVFGHIALHGVPHISFQGRQIFAPKSPTGYERFHARTINTTEGLVDVGVLAFDTDHAKPHHSAKGAVTHYETTGSIAAAVRAGEDRYGVWISGVLLPDLTDDQRLRLSLADYSGDWRDEGKGLDLKAVLAVPAGHEGFYTPKSQPQNREEYALVASGGVTADHIDQARQTAGLVNIAALTDAVADEQQRRTRVAGAQARVRAMRVNAAARRVRTRRALQLAAAAGSDTDDNHDADLANWISETGTGHLPPYIRKIADALIRDHGFTESRAIATAVNRVKRWCRGGDDVKPDTRAKACAALAEWETKRAEARAS